jgi:hypothetical protein
MRLVLHASLFFLAATLLPAQTGKLRPEVTPPEDAVLRAEAIRLMERANRLSTPVWPANESVVNFHVLEPGVGEADAGELRVSVATPVRRRREYTYGSYKFVQVEDGGEFATTRSQSEPAVMTSVRKLLPVFLGEFEQDDVIRRIEDANSNGQPARCILFQTLKGDHEIPGRACVDADQGWLVEVTQGDETIRQSRFFQFNNGFLPGHIERWAGGRKQFEIDQKVVVRESYPDNYFDYPAGASIKHTCREFHRAFADNSPQPPQKAVSSELVEVRVHGFIGKDGKPYGLKPLDTARPDLAEEAVRIVSTWTFHPAMCEYDPATMEMDFVIHFKGW